MIIKLLAATTILVACCSAVPIRRYERLPNSTRPLSYNLHFVTNVHEDGRDFNGTAQIQIQVLESTDRIVLHAFGFYNVKLNLVDLQKEEEINSLVYEFDAKAEQIIITAAPALRLIAGQEYILTISYNANPCSGRRGLCVYYYEDVENENKTVPLAATHLSRGNARMVFPCYDEPALKANFTISVSHGNNYTALSNMPRQGEPIPEVDGYVTTKFLESPPMSTYVVAVTVSNYENITEKVGNTDVRLFTKPKSKGGRLALEISKKALVLMSDYFNISFPLPKIDHFSVPGMASRGMENWGLITYAEFVLLEEDPFNFKTVTHELTHMWFGNLVTPAWWSQIWLSEGISTFYGYKFINLIKPEWELSIDYRYMWYNEDVCSLTCDAKSETDYDSVFGIMAYVKGSFLMAIMEKLLTEEVLRKGIIKYLQKHQYSSTIEDDLFDCVADAMEESLNPYFKEKTSLKRAMKSWSTQKFYPLVTVVRNYDNGTFTVYQEPYKTQGEGNSEMWWIPITFTTSTILDFDNVTADLIFPDIKQMEINPAELGKPLDLNDWLIVNKEQPGLGLYRVKYDERNWNLITCGLLKDPTVIPETIRIQMMKDLFELFIEGHVEGYVFFNYLTYLKNETSRMPWLTASTVLRDIFKDLEIYEDQPKENLRQVVADIISSSPEFYNVDENSEDFELSSENELLFKLACDIGLEKCDHIIDVIFEKIKSQGNVSRNEHDLFLYGSCHAHKHARDDVKNFINDYMMSENYSYIQYISKPFFFCTNNKHELKDLLERALNETTDNEVKEDIAYFAINDPTCLEVVVELLQEGHSELENLFAKFAESAIYSPKSRDHKDMLVKTWSKMGYPPNEHHYYSTDKELERNDKVRDKLVQWLKLNPLIRDIHC